MRNLLFVLTKHNLNTAVSQITHGAFQIAYICTKYFKCVKCIYTEKYSRNAVHYSHTLEIECGTTDP